MAGPRRGVPREFAVVIAELQLGRDAPEAAAREERIGVAAAVRGKLVFSFGRAFKSSDGDVTVINARASCHGIMTEKSFLLLLGIRAGPPSKAPVVIARYRDAAFGPRLQHDRAIFGS